ncbi:MAG: DNA-directed RNA polymerase subunit beta' [Leptospiraceae bacterium]|nr:DNA-directed RNA polymerase subunit beta' [Leptospiraceae bacterium]
MLKKKELTFDAVKLMLASPDRIREWSYGEVKKAETINYRNLKPEKDGLFCERIFGTTRDYECHCGKFKSVRYKGVVCDKCGVEVTSSKVRRERMGHIELATPVAHFWFYKNVPSRIGILINKNVNQIKKILNYEVFVVIDPADSDKEVGELIKEEEYNELLDEYGEKFLALTGAEAIKELLSRIDIEQEIHEIRSQISSEPSKNPDKRLLKRLEILEALKESGNRPEWMILEVIPVIPPELRPMVQLEGGKFASADLNDLYRRVITRNNRLKRLLQLKAPDIIIRNEKRMLQDAVDSLIENSKKGKQGLVKGKGNRPLKSIADNLKGKSGRFRQNLLGKRVDYSGRSVIVIGPNLKLHEMGLPRKMALELFKPFIMRRLLELDLAPNIKTAKKKIEEESPEANEALEYVIKEHPVLLNRAPTLHRLGIQAFLPVIVEGKAIQLHPLVCHAFNADFDGDQMAVHVPLSPKAQLECWMLMLSSHNILNPANGQPIVFPTQDMVLGLYLLTSKLSGDVGEGKSFSSLEEIYHALESKVVGLRAEVRVLYEDKIIYTTPGRFIFNSILPKGYPYVNNPITDKEAIRIIADVYANYGIVETVEMLEKFKELGFKYSTIFAPSIAISDIKVPAQKVEFIQKANEEVEKVTRDYKNGIITNEERYKKVIEIWDRTNEKVMNAVFEELKKDQSGFNPIYAMAESGARGSKQQIRQLAGMRGLMAKPSGEIIELPIRSNFKEGLGILEFFISTHGARKGLADTALKTADAGYLTRRLVDIAQDVIITEEDCKTEHGLWISAVKDRDKVVISLGDRAFGRILAKDLEHPITKEVLFKKGTLITKEIGKTIDALGIEKIYIRSILTCESKRGVCAKCYGLDLARLKLVELGEAVGIIAAQSIGQPGTQLTMRTFHVGGVATNVERGENEVKAPSDCISCIIKKVQGSVVKDKTGKHLLATRGSIELKKIHLKFTLEHLRNLRVRDGDRVISGQQIADEYFDGNEWKRGLTYSGMGIARIIDNLFYIEEEDIITINLKIGSEIFVQQDEFCQPNQLLAKYDTLNDIIITDMNGEVEYKDIELDENLKQDEQGYYRVYEVRGKKYNPTIIVKNKDETKEYPVPVGAVLLVENKGKVTAGDVLYKVTTVKEIKTRDITGGLPRVEELFEARSPKKRAILAPIDGIVVDKNEVIKDKRIIYINPLQIDQKEEEKEIDFEEIQKMYERLAKSSKKHSRDEEELEEAYEEVDYQDYNIYNEIESEVPTRYKIAIPVSLRLLVRNGDQVKKGEPITEGQLDPHDILRIKGLDALHEYLIQEIQEVYRLQGVFINDKHLEIIIRQMLRKVEITDPGDTNFVLHQQVDKIKVKEENERVIAEGGVPCKYKPILLGLTRASLNTDSFLSAASFQETTRVLTDAALKGKIDELVGLKENIIVGHLIPAGTGLKKYRDIEIFYEEYGDIQKAYKKRLELLKREE